jgi:hypothetical protein
VDVDGFTGNHPVTYGYRYNPRRNAAIKATQIAGSSSAFRSSGNRRCHHAIDAATPKKPHAIAKSSSHAFTDGPLTLNDRARIASRSTSYHEVTLACAVENWTDSLSELQPGRITRVAYRTKFFTLSLDGSELYFCPSTVREKARVRVNRDDHGKNKSR